MDRSYSRVGLGSICNSRLSAVFHSGHRTGRASTSRHSPDLADRRWVLNFCYLNQPHSGNTTLFWVAMGLCSSGYRAVLRGVCDDTSASFLRLTGHGQRPEIGSQNGTAHRIKLNPAPQDPSTTSFHQLPLLQSLQLRRGNHYQDVPALNFQHYQRSPTWSTNIEVVNPIWSTWNTTIRTRLDMEKNRIKFWEADYSEC